MLSPCGTVAAYQRHIYHKTPVCEPCKEAAREYRRNWQRDYRKKTKAACQMQRCRNLAKIDGLCLRHHNKMVGADRWSLADRIEDWLSIDGGWLTAAGIAEDLGRNVTTVERALRLLRAGGVIESRVVELAMAGYGYNTRIEWRSA